MLLFPEKMTQEEIDERAEYGENLVKNIEKANTILSLFETPAWLLLQERLLYARESAYKELIDDDGFNTDKLMAIRNKLLVTEGLFSMGQAVADEKDRLDKELIELQNSGAEGPDSGSDS